MGENTSFRSMDGLNQQHNRPFGLTDLLTRMKTLIDDSTSKLERLIETSYYHLSNDIKALRIDVEKLKAERASDISLMTDSINQLDDVVTQNKEAIARMGKANDLLLTGVPYSRKEDTDKLFRVVAKALGYGDSDVPTVFTKRLARVPIATDTNVANALRNGISDVPHAPIKRLAQVSIATNPHVAENEILDVPFERVARFPNATDSTPPILVQFTFKAARDEFFRRYLSTRSLCLQQIGFHSNRRVYLSENLTESARAIMRRVVKLKKEGHLRTAYSKDGIIFIKSDSDVQARPISNLDQLESIGEINA